MPPIYSTVFSDKYFVGLSNKLIPKGAWIDYANAFVLKKGKYGYQINLPGVHSHEHEWQDGTLEWEWVFDGDDDEGRGDVVGCGLVLHPDNKLAIFFTGNATLLGLFFINNSH
jgi:hypothetical protein